MKMLVAFLGICLCAGIFCSPAVAQDEDSCEAATVDLDVFISKQPNQCSRDEDCDGYYFRADSCASAVIMMKAAVTNAFTEQLEEKQRMVLIACPGAESDKSVCSPIPFKAVCNDHRCTDAGH